MVCWDVYGAIPFLGTELVGGFTPPTNNYPYGRVCVLCSKSEEAHTIVVVIIDHASLSHLLSDLTIKKEVECHHPTSSTLTPH